MYGALTSYSLVGLDLCFFVLIFLSGPSLLNHFYFGLSLVIYFEAKVNKKSIG